MGRLIDFKEYLVDRINAVGEVEKALCALQSKYESYYGEISQVREGELQQLMDHTVQDRDELPQWFTERLNGAQVQVDNKFATEFEQLTKRRDELLAQAEEQRQQSRAQEQQMRQANAELDDKEEQLKGRNAKLLTDIEQYNQRIRSMSSGFGFFANFFKARQLAAQRAKLDAEQADVAANIESLRLRWKKEQKAHFDQEREIQSQWVELRTEAAAVQTKVEYLEQAKARIVLRSTVELVLYELAKDIPKGAEDDPPCPRCRRPNPAQNHFCHICAQRLTDDRPDFEGSIHEIAELNVHYQRFSEGMKACQEIIGLIRGFESGLEAFLESVKDMIGSQLRHSLGTLNIDVPAASVQYGQNIDRLGEMVRRDLSLHPTGMAQQVEQLIAKVFNEEYIKQYFETMGQELSRQADAQW